MLRADLSKAPKGFVEIPEGPRVFLIKKIAGAPRTGALTDVDAVFVDAEGATIKNHYDLTVDGGYAAFYYLVTNGCGFEVDAAFGINQLEGCYVELDVVHKPREQGGVFNNIGKTLGPGKPFSAAHEPPPGGDEGGWD